MLSAYARPSISQPNSDADLAIDSFSATVPSLATVDVDTLLLSSLCSVDYKFCVFNVAEDKYRSFKMLGTKMSAGTLEDTLHSIIGDTLSFDVDFVVVATDAILQITNNELFTLTVAGVRTT